MSPPPLGLLLASFAPLVLEFDPEQWQAWKQFSIGDERKENADENVIAGLAKDLDKNISMDEFDEIFSGDDIYVDYEFEYKMRKRKADMRSLVSKLLKTEPAEKEPKVK